MKLERGGMIDFSQSLIDVHPIPPLSTIFYMPVFNSVAKKIYSLATKNIGALAPHFALSPGYAYR
jgi:hypothetical protein